MSELGLLSLTQLQKSVQDSQSNPRSVSWMWNPKQQGARQDQVVDDDSWEVRAFAEDTGNVMGTTWPPRSYTCTFCRREFRSAQALGGHMNVHRRDRARLHQVQQQEHHPAAINSSSGTTCPSSFIIPTQEFLAANGGLCLLYQLPNPNNINGAAPLLHHESSFSSASSVLPSTLLSISSNNLPLPPHDYLMTSSSACPRTDSHCHQYYVKGSSADQDQPADSRPSCVEDIEELDLELRLGPS